MSTTSLDLPWPKCSYFEFKTLPVLFVSTEMASDSQSEMRNWLEQKRGERIARILEMIRTPCVAFTIVNCLGEMVALRFKLQEMVASNSPQHKTSNIQSFHIDNNEEDISSIYLKWLNLFNRTTSKIATIRKKLS